MELTLQDVKSTLVVSENIFDCVFNEALIHQVISSYAATSRQGTRAQKSRANVAGSSRKPWRQKGTGRARAGSVKSPIWRSGGVTFAARPQNHCQKINKKMYRGALRSILSELVRQNRLIVTQDFCIEAPKTKFLVQKIKEMSLKDVLIVIGERNNNLFLASRNLHKVSVRNAFNIDPISLIIFNKVIMTVNAVKKLEEMLT